MKENTGYPHIDKMWQKYYDEEFLKQELPKQTMYDYMKESSKKNIDKTAITYYGNKILYGDLYENVDKASKVLTALGVNANDRIMYLMPNIPETAYLMYGGSQIGAVSDFVDPRPDSVDLKISAQKILSLFKAEGAKHLVVLDRCFLGMIKPIENELKELGVENIVIVSASDSMNLFAKGNYLTEIATFDGLKELKAKLNEMKTMDELLKKAISTSCLNVINYSDLAKNVNYEQFTKFGYTPNKLDLIVHTSGTTSNRPKPIVLTNDNLNAYVHQTKGANMPMSEGDRALHMLPYFAAYGVVNVTHAGLCYSNNLIQIPEFKPANFGKLILKNKPQTIIGAPTWFLNLLNDKNLTKADLSFLKMITYGGDTLEIKDEEAINKFLKEHNCKEKITKGHGMSETAGCASFAVGEYNIPGSIGIPMPYTIYALLNPETKELVKFEEGQEEIEGELLISSPVVTSGILDGEKYVNHETYDGIDFIHTKDIARMNKDGIMTFLARSDRSFTRFDGFKVKPYELEKLIKNFEGVKYCVITPFFDETLLGNMIMANIVLEDGIELNDEEKIEFSERLINECFVNNPNTQTRQIPAKIKFKESMPLTANSKINYNALVKEGITGEEISVILEETNISVGGIKIVGPEKNKTLRK
jgi:long-chain acyl-CoA synthetase